MHHLQTAILYSAILFVTVHVLSTSASNIDRSFPCFNCHVPREGFEPPRNGSGPFSLSVSLTRYVEQYVTAFTVIPAYCHQVYSAIIDWLSSTNICSSGYITACQSSVSIITQSVDPQGL